GLPSLTNPEYLSYTFDIATFEQFFFYIIISSFLIAIFFYDLMYQEIPDHFSLPAIAVAIAGGLIFGIPEWTNMVVGGVVLGLFFFLQFWVSKGKWIGGGDIRMGVLMGVLLGWELGLLALIIGYAIGAIYAIVLLITKQANRKSAIALGPFLIIGIFATLFYGEQILNWYLNILL
ncbi:MAG: A24 family peptidase, partial [Candidatus Gracilibacteria bacterium]